FTGAVDNKTGRFEAAHGGTIFLDEISSLTMKLQVKLLRVLQEREFERVGESRTIRVDTRVIAATNESLEELIEKGRFRDDLYYRLNVVPICLPPLRERDSDILALARFFLERYCEENRRETPPIPIEIVGKLEDYDWPGNVRELENYVERSVVLGQGQGVNFEAMLPGGERRLPSSKSKTPDMALQIQTLVKAALQASPTDNGELHMRLMRDLERELIEQVMQQCNGVLVKAAAKLGINRNTLHKKLTEFNMLVKAEKIAE
ncbi:MAG TPA: sigma 54-interacting transcriptional regulator, partial [Gemmataceae bacterium]|nr:sigma 54-interacting transcriptional regulator [Gemmataceae bacterium]